MDFWFILAHIHSHTHTLTPSTHDSFFEFFFIASLATADNSNNKMWNMKFVKIIALQLNATLNKPHSIRKKHKAITIYSLLDTIHFH